MLTGKKGGMNKVVVVIQGGVGNQLFCYAAARRLALVSEAELVIDDVTGFSRDRQYRRRYMLDHFHISARKASSAERLEPFPDLRRRVLKGLSRWRPFGERTYLEQEGTAFEERLLGLKVRGVRYLEGYWQSERYFLDVAQTIREDLRIVLPTDPLILRLGSEIRNYNSVAIHVRWFDMLENVSTNNVSADYYNKAIAMIEKKVDSPRYFVFSDNPAASRLKLALPSGRATFVDHNDGADATCSDLWLMTQCKHFIIANSTFSWWGAWLADCNKKTVVAPDSGLNDKTVWSFSEIIPDGWIKIKR